MKRVILFAFTGLLILVHACVEPFEIENLTHTDILVIEGLLSTQQRNHQVSVSRTSAIDQRKFIPEEQAEVWITNGKDEVISLSEVRAGIYQTPPYAGVAGEKYTLHLNTSDGREYASREVVLKDGPEINSVTANFLTDQTDSEDGIHITVNTEDVSGATRFYRWSFVETYQVQAPFPSNYIWLGGNEVMFRTHGIDTCWVTDSLKNILIKTTAGQDQDKVTEFPLRFIPGYSYIMRHKYSILVQQYALTEESYQYWENLRIMNENQGSLADIQPGTLPGNVFSVTDQDETVLGYFEACKVSEKRVFFTPFDFFHQGYKIPESIRSSCREILPIMAPEHEIGNFMEIYSDEMFIWDSYGFSPVAVFELMPKFCCDCRDLGPNVKPPFWE
jgi:hypothetical protein